MLPCPRCRSPLDKGFAEMNRSLMGWLFGRGYTPVVLQFVGEATGERDILHPAQRNVAYACQRCGTTIVTGESWLP